MRNRTLGFLNGIFPLSGVLAGALLTAFGVPAPAWSAAVQPADAGAGLLTLEHNWHSPLTPDPLPAGVKRIAVPQEVDLDSRRDGVWSVDGDILRWTLSVRVSDATAPG
jgi:hypothetical protein